MIVIAVVITVVSGPVYISAVPAPIMVVMMVADANTVGTDDYCLGYGWR